MELAKHKQSQPLQLALSRNIAVQDLMFAHCAKIISH